MSPNNNPHWRIVSRAYSAENLELGSKILDVFIPEVSGFIDGEVTAHRTTLQTNGVDHRGNPYTVAITTANSIQATWRQMGSNRVTPPNVRRGERIDIWQYENVDKYYWSASGEDDHLRRLESATWAFSNTKDEGTKEIDESNSYNFKVSTHEKIIDLNTSQSDDEPYSHHIQIDTKNGNMHYRDSDGNYIQVEAKTRTITMENADGSKAVLEGQNATLHAPNEVNIKCKTLNIDAESINEKVNNKSTRASTITEEANTKQVNADIKTSGTLTNNDKNVGGDHVHGGVQGGGSTTSGPS